jgi:hypothetical protein
MAIKGTFSSSFLMKSGVNFLQLIVIASLSPILLIKWALNNSLVQIYGQTIEIHPSCAVLLRVNHPRVRSPGKSVWPSGIPANKSGAFPRNFEAGSNVIDVSERQREKQDSPMTAIEAGK